jgi:hypothetical protein
LKVTTSWHHYRETKPSLLHVWLHMDGLGPVRFHTPNDGLSLEADQPHGPYDMDEYGHATVEDDLPDFPMTRFASSTSRTKSSWPTTSTWVRSRPTLRKQ